MHYRLRPSAAAVWVLCSGALSLLADAPDIHSTDDTVREEGTACHWLAHMLSAGLDVPEGQHAPNNVVVDRDMQDAANTYLAVTRAWGPLVHYEQPVSCWRIHKECGGTPDAWAWDASTKTLYIADLKYGFRFVDVVGNWQLICYFVGILDSLGVADDDVTVVFTIVQPRAFHRDGAIREWRVQARMLRGYVATLQDAARRVFSDAAMCVTNAGCEDCGARQRCEAIQTSALGYCESSSAPTPHDLPFAAAEDELRRMEHARDAIEARITGLTSQVTHAMRLGGISRHYAMEPGRGTTAWNEGTENKVRMIAKLFRKSVDKPLQLITPIQAEKELGKDIVKMYSTRHSGGMKLVKQSASKMAQTLRKANTQ